MTKNLSTVMALLVVLASLSALHHSGAQVPDDVESGWMGLIDVNTNLRNLVYLDRTALSGLSRLDLSGIMETMRGFPENAGQIAGLYLSWIDLFLGFVFALIPLVNIVWILPSILLCISSGYLIYSNSGGFLRFTGIVQMLGAIPILNLLLFPLLPINLVLQSVIIVLGRGGSAPGEQIVDRAIILTAPVEIREGEDFQVSATFNGKPLPGALITLANETVVTDSNGTATLIAPDVREDTRYRIEAGGTEGKGSTTILVKNESV